MTRKRFQELVAEAMRHIPPDLCEAMENVAVIVEDRPSDEILAELEISPPDTLYGLYQGIPLTEREWGHVADLPDRITIFREPILEDAEDEDDVVRAVGETIIHEVRPSLRAQRGGNRGDRGDLAGTAWPTMRRSRSTRAPSSAPPLGQHFLEAAWVAKVVDVIAASPGHDVIEIGPGRGALTFPAGPACRSRAGR